MSVELSPEVLQERDLRVLKSLQKARHSLRNKKNKDKGHKSFLSTVSVLENKLSSVPNENDQKKKIKVPR